MDYQVVILAAGKGKRMEDDLPKVLLPLKGQPCINYLLDEVKKIPDIGKPILVVGYKHSDIQKALGESYLYAIQRQQLGTGHAVMAAESKISAKNIIVLYGDVPFVKSSSIKKLMSLHNNKKAMISMFTTRVPDAKGPRSNFLHFGRIIRDKYNEVAKIVEYKDASDEEKAVTEINPGIYAFNTEWLWNNIHLIKNDNSQNEYYLTDIAALAIEEGCKIYTAPISYKEVIGLNTKEQLSFAERMLGS